MVGRRSESGTLLVCGWVAVMAIPDTAWSQPKQDIRGFRPEVTVDSFKDSIKPLKCSAQQCALEGGTLEFIESPKLVPPMIKFVGFRFESSEEPARMVEEVSKQYGARPVNDVQHDIARALGRMEYVPFVGNTMVVGGTIGQWNLSKTLHLHLELSQPGKINKYRLGLVSSKVTELERAAVAKERALEKEKNRLAKPPPKF
jgi:hypothetical protein